MPEITDIPRISITQENEDEESSDGVSDCDMDYGHNANTDVEDFDSNDEDEKSGKDLKIAKKLVKKSSPNVTDIEDYNDSGSEDEKSEVLPELRISLTEFLDCGVTEELSQMAENCTSKCKSMIKDGTFLTALLVDEDPGCLTDYENYDASEDEIADETLNQHAEKNNNEIEFSPDQDNFNISDKVGKEVDCYQDDVSDLENEEGACALCNYDGLYDGNVSEVEDVMFSGDEEIIEIEGSDDDDYSEGYFPEIDVSFLTDGRTHSSFKNAYRTGSFIRPERTNEEPLTDIEKLNSSDSEASTESDHPGIPLAKASFASLTDVEDLDFEEMSDILADIQQIHDIKIPPPIREISITKESKNGTPFTTVMPLQPYVKLGIEDYYIQKGLTDTEDISCAEDDLLEPIRSSKDTNPSIIESLVENANVQNCESVKINNQRKTDYNDVEPVTEVEEIFMAGTARRKKSKGKNQGKPKSKYLNVKSNAERSVTDVEELEVSDFEHSSERVNLATQNNLIVSPTSASPELKTDLEIISGEDECPESEEEVRSEISVPGMESCISTVTLIEGTTKKLITTEVKSSSQSKSGEHDSSGVNSQNATDVEDVQMPSDVDENYLYDTYSRADTISPGELQDLLNDSGMSVVHEKCGKPFNLDDEKHHIKGMNLTDIHTDVEYLEDEMGTDKKQSKLSKLKEDITRGTKVCFEGQTAQCKSEEGEYDYVRNEATNLIDSILEQSIMIISAQQCNDYNSDSDHYAITCDVNGFDMVKSPTIESLSGKSFDDNMSVNDDNNIVNVPQLTTTGTDILTASYIDVNDIENIQHDDNIILNNLKSDQNIFPNEHYEKNIKRIERKFERLSSQLEDLEESAIRFDTDFDNMLSKDDMSNLQSDFSRISWDESVSGTTTAADVGLSTPDNDLQDLPTESSAETTRSEIPKPTPRISKTLQSDILQVQDELIKINETEIEFKTSNKSDAIVEDVDFKQSKKFWESLESSQTESQPIPIPKPRSQLKTTDSLKGDDSIASGKSVRGDESSISGVSISHDSKISSEQQVEYSETSSLHTSLEEDKPKDDDSMMSDGKLEDETFPDVGKMEKMSFEKSDTVISQEIEDDDDATNAKQASFYIGESSQNIITKSSTDKRHDYAFDNKGYQDLSNEEREKLIRDSKEEEEQESKISPKKSPIRIFRQDSETRNDILECETFLEREKTFSLERESIELKKESEEIQEPSQLDDQTAPIEPKKRELYMQDVQFEEFTTHQVSASPAAKQHLREETVVELEGPPKDVIFHEATIEEQKKHVAEHIYFEEQVKPMYHEAITEEVPTHVTQVVETQVQQEFIGQEVSSVQSKYLHSAEIVGKKDFDELKKKEVTVEAQKVDNELTKTEQDSVKYTTVETDSSKPIKPDEVKETHTEKTVMSEETHKSMHKIEQEIEMKTAEDSTKFDGKTKFEAKLELNLDKSELELSEKSFSKASKYEEFSSSVDHRPVLSPVKGFKSFANFPESMEGFKKSLNIEPSTVDQTMVEQTLEEVKESLDAVQEELIEVVKDGKLIKESPSEFEFKLLPNIKYTTDPIHESFQEDSSSTVEPLKDTQKKHETADTSKAEDVASTSSTDDTSKLDVVHRVRKEAKADSANRWSVPDLDQSSSGDASSQYQSFERTDSRPLSSDVENLLQSSEYQTAQDASLLPESSEYVSAVSTLEHSGKTISSRESMKSLDSESSANLGSIEVSELSETLVPSTAEGDIDDFDADDDEKFCGILMEDFKTDEPVPSQMKRSQEMTFEHEQSEAITVARSTDILKDDDDIQSYPKFEGSYEENRLDETKFPSSLEEGSVLSMSLSSASYVDTVVENVDELASSLGASSLAGIDMQAFIRDDYTGTSFEEPSKTEKIDSMVMTTSTGVEQDKSFASTQITTTTITTSTEVSESEPKKKGHKRSESSAFGPTDFLKEMESAKAKAADSSFEEEEEETKRISVPKEDKKDSESESDYDQYESEYSRSYRSPQVQKKPKEKRVETFDKDQDPEKRPFTPSQSVSEPILEDVYEDIERAETEEYERRMSQNVQDLHIPDITVTEDLKKYTEEGVEIVEEEDFEDKVLYKVKTQEELHKAEDSPLHFAKEQEFSLKEDQLQELIQRQYEAKIADITKYSQQDDDQEKADSPDSFEMLEQPDISDEFVIIEEVAKEANEFDTEGKSISIKNVKYVKKHDEEVEQIIVKSAPAAPNEGSTRYKDDMNFEFEDSPPTAQDQEGVESAEAAAISKRWVEMQLSDNATHLRYPYEMGGGMLEDIKEEDTEFEVGSSRISSFKDSFSSTPEYDILAGRKYFTKEHDDVSMSSLQEFESLEQAISLENRRLHHQGHQGSQDSLSNGSFTRRYLVRSGGQGDDVSLSSLKDFEGLENACIEAHLIEIKAKEEAALLLSRSDESNKSNPSNGEGISSSKASTPVTVAQAQPIRISSQEIEDLIKAKLEGCEEEASNLMEVSSDSLELALKKSKSSNDDEKKGSEHGSVDSLEINKSGDIMTSSIDSFEISKDATARSSRSDVDSLEQQILQEVRRDSVDSIEFEQALRLPAKTDASYSIDQKTSVTTTVITQGPTHITTRTVTGSTTSVTRDGGPEMIKDISSDSLNLKTDPELLLTSTESLDRTSSTATNATYQNENDSLMSGSMTSCGSNTLIDTFDSNFTEFYQGGTSSSQYRYEESRTQSRDGEKRYEYIEIFDKDHDKFDTTQTKSGGDSSPEPKQDEQKK